MLRVWLVFILLLTLVFLVSGCSGSIGLKDIISEEIHSSGFESSAICGVIYEK